MLRRTRIASQVSVHKCCLVCYDFGVVALLSLGFFRGVSSPVYASIGVYAGDCAGSRGPCFSSCSASMAFFVMVDPQPDFLRLV